MFIFKLLLSRVDVFYSYQVFISLKIFAKNPTRLPTINVYYFNVKLKYDVRMYDNICIVHLFLSSS